jgi:hypothetical protein
VRLDRDREPMDITILEAFESNDDLQLRLHKLGTTPSSALVVH